MTREPLVSIITPSYNSSRTIRETIESVKKQTYHNWELIIVDDHSSDKTLEIIKREQENERRIRIIPLEKNAGAANARNVAIKNAKGDYIAFLDSDDLWSPNKLTEQIKFMEENGYAFTYTSYEHINEEGSQLGETIKAKPRMDYHDMLKRKGTIGTLTVVLNRKKIKVDISMPEIETSEDFALWLKILKSGIVAYGIPKVLAYYRIGSGQISGNKLKAAKRVWYVYRHIEKLNILSAFRYFCHYTKYGIKKTYFSKDKT